MHCGGMGRGMINIGRPADRAQKAHLGHGEWLPVRRRGNLGGRMGDQVGRPVCFGGRGGPSAYEPVSPFPSAAAISASGALLCWSLEDCTGPERDRPRRR